MPAHSPDLSIRSSASSWTRRAEAVRHGARLWLILYALLVVAVPALDASNGHVERTEAHWQDAGDTSCPPLHDPAICQLCQLLGNGGHATPAGSLLSAPTGDAMEPSSALRLRPQHASTAVRPPTRAPPVV